MWMWDINDEMVGHVHIECSAGKIPDQMLNQILLCCKYLAELVLLSIYCRLN